MHEELIKTLDMISETLILQVTPTPTGLKIELVEVSEETYNKLYNIKKEECNQKFAVVPVNEDGTEDFANSVIWEKCGTCGHSWQVNEEKEESDESTDVQACYAGQCRAGYFSNTHE